MKVPCKHQTHCECEVRVEGACIGEVDPQEALGGSGLKTATCGLLKSAQLQRTDDPGGGVDHVLNVVRPA